MKLRFLGTRVGKWATALPLALLMVATGVSATTDVNILEYQATEMRIEYGYDSLFPVIPEPQLSEDGTTLTNPALPVVILDSGDWETPAYPQIDAETLAEPEAQLEYLDGPLDTVTEGGRTNVAATFNIEYVPAGGTDRWGEACYAFPDAARAVFNAAAAKWSTILQSNVPITINACWASFSGSVLGYSGGGNYHRDFSGAPAAGTWYQASLANSLAGSDLDPGNRDMHITYNGNFAWYFGLDGYPSSSQHDLLTVVLHEMAHGLHFSGAASYSGGVGTVGISGYPTIYDRFMRDGSGTSLWGGYTNSSTALGSALRSNNLWFHGSNAMSANGGSRVKMYAPSTWSGGSSYSHLDYATFNNTANQLMVYAVSAGEAVHDPGPVARGLLRDLGWVPTAPPPAATLVSPSGTISDTTPTFTWNAVSSSTWYQLWVSTSSGAKKYSVWLTPSQTGCFGGTGTCSYTPSTALGNGHYDWWIRTWSSSGYGPWSASMRFTVLSGGVPGAATLVSPSGTIGDTTPTFTWNAVSNATWYQLWVSTSGGAKRYSVWLTASQTGCSGGTGICSYTPSTALGNGHYDWWIRTWNSSGYGLWSASMRFSVGVPGAATLVSPSGTISDTTPTFTWNAVSNATWYQLWVSTSGGAKRYSVWLTASQTGCSGGTGTCSYTPSTALGNGHYDWWIRTWSSSGYGLWSASMRFNVVSGGVSGATAQ